MEPTPTKLTFQGFAHGSKLERGKQKMKEAERKSEREKGNRLQYVHITTTPLRWMGDVTLIYEKRKKGRKKLEPSRNSGRNLGVRGRINV